MARPRSRAATRLWWSDALFEFREAEKSLRGGAYTTSVEKFHSASERFLKAAIVCGARTTPERIHYLPRLADEAARRHGTAVPPEVRRALTWLQARYERYPPRRMHAQSSGALNAKAHAGTVRRWARGMVAECLGREAR
ncbi:MAG: HEPN domain-containing protein [Euryarchaeota archaeon]|nr:HEPN domain-containing protein [Euryarchaeota archaeon]